MQRYLNRLGSMDFLAKSFLDTNRSNFKRGKDALVMSMPFLKLYMNSSDQGINKTNKTLTVEEQINLCNVAKERDGSSDQIPNEKLFSLEDLFALDSNEIENNVYQLINLEDSRALQHMKYVQVRREKIQTMFRKHDVIQMIDISQKILYEMAVGEKRLFSLINATVSHEMRNPTNSIQA